MPWWRFAFALLLTYLLQTTLVRLIAPPAVDLFVVLALVCAWSAPPVEARLAGWSTGFLQDVGSAGPLGLHALALGLLVFLLTYLREHVNREVWWVRWLVGLVAVFPLQLLVHLHERYWQDAAGSWARMLAESLATAVVTGLLAALVLGLPTLLGMRRRRFAPYRRW
jgi:rod shape-determining protein MreD